MANIRRLSWDSDFFGIEVGEWSGTGIPGMLDFFDLIYCKSSDAIQDVVLPGFRCTFYEQKLVFEKTLLETSVADAFIQEYKKDIGTPALYELAYESGKHSRFRLDSQIGNDKFEELYRLWVDNSLNGKFADKVLIFLTDARVVGFVTFTTKDNQGQIGLIAVSPKFQGRGIGKKLIHAVENALLNCGINNLQIPTQASNVSACAFYEKLGYKVVVNQYIGHFRKIKI